MMRKLLGREVQQIGLYRAALTHRSAQQENNERLEFLGDAVLGLLIAEELFRRFPSGDEGDLSRLRARLVSSAPLAVIGADIGIGAMLHLGSGELRSGGFRRESILADATALTLLNRRMVSPDHFTREPDGGTKATLRCIELQPSTVRFEIDADRRERVAVILIQGVQRPSHAASS